jgi:predicted metalloprotease with PDZ domain
VSETYTHISGNIKHLRNDFTAKIKPENLEEFNFKTASYTSSLWYSEGFL